MTSENNQRGAMNISLIPNTASAQWTTVPILTLLIFLLVLIINATVLFVFYSNSHLRTPFTIYVINLFAANIIIALLQNPLDVLFTLYGQWRFGHAACTVYLYGSYVVSGGTMISHVVISANRIWAIVFPIHYRLHHTKKLAVGICISVWVYVHVLIVPGLVVDGMWYRLPLEVAGCTVNLTRQVAWNGAVHWLIYNLAEIFVVGAYPFIWYFRKASRKVNNRSEMRPPRSSDEHHSSKTVQLYSLPAITPPAETVRPDPKPRARAYSLIVRHKDTSHAFTMLTFLTISVALCWTPIMVFYGLAPYVQFSPVFYPVARAIYALQAVVDPIALTLALNEVWRAFVRMCSGCGRRHRKPSIIPTVPS